MKILSLVPSESSLPPPFRSGVHNAGILLPAFICTPTTLASPEIGFYAAWVIPHYVTGCYSSWLFSIKSALRLSGDGLSMDPPDAKLIYTRGCLETAEGVWKEKSCKWEYSKKTSLIVVYSVQQSSSIIKQERYKKFIFMDCKKRSCTAKSLIRNGIQGLQS